MKKSKTAVALISALMLVIVFIFGLMPPRVSADEPIYDPPKSVDVSKAGYTFAELKEYFDAHSRLGQSGNINNCTYPEYCYWIGDNYYIIDITDHLLLSILYIFDKYPEKINSEEKIYFLSYYLETDSGVYSRHLISFSYIYFYTTDSNRYNLQSETGISEWTRIIYKKAKTQSGASSDSAFYTNFTRTWYDKSDQDYKKIRDSFGTSTYTYLVNGLGLKGYPSFMGDVDMSDVIDVSDNFEKPLKSQIDVTLTPDFSIGMDRSIPNSAFDTSVDYWKMDVTNNSNVNIQFKCYIIPGTGHAPYVDEWSQSEELKSIVNSEGISIDVNTDDFIPKVPDETVWMLEKNQWIYSKDTATQDAFQSADSFLVNKPTSCIFLGAGQTFTQMIKWNQLNLNANQPYQFLLIACECPYDKASDIHISLASDNYSQSQKHIISQSYYIISDIMFSVKNPLVYDSHETYGGVIPNTGRKQVDDDYWKMNAIVDSSGEIDIRNADYVNGWRLHPNGGSTVDKFDSIDIDGIGIDDVKDFVSSSQNYFNLIGSVLYVFPAFIWKLIAFGLTLFIVVGIFKAIL